MNKNQEWFLRLFVCQLVIMIGCFIAYLMGANGLGNFFFWCWVVFVVFKWIAFGPHRWNK